MGLCVFLCATIYFDCSTGARGHGARGYEGTGYGEDHRTVVSSLVLVRGLSKDGSRAHLMSAAFS